MRQIILGATIINEGRQVVGSVCLSDERIESIYIGIDKASDLPDELLQGAEIVEAHGLWLLPGCIDDQVHFREPGLTHKGDIAHESRAAVAGGVTSYMDMPNVKPPTVTLEALLDKRQRAQETSWANYAFYFGGTNDNAPEACAIDPALI
ncbi:MAG: dihydroorotase, partial [Porphyromonas sp.]